ncbi:DNA adenine methylase [Klebsiella phage RCIP0006]|uniref:site-specific DNA-methyltransferase (adenine-specific) n=2 Tax=Slopekvirus TaxID=1985328 RepID=A0A6H0X1Q2_9CAUD|nr:DNA methyltransferase [Escherichia phage phT4A]QEG10205.1 DNA adenine methylase [Klebsiella phage KMI7]QIW86080.1 DNA adenine methylase [Klebsiella phage P-KP2]UJP30395.1 DNA adenine methylase [Raoultella phage Rpl1]UUG67127.1 DNA adenine methylase [Klebsiella phage PSKm2DI]WDQ26522.1 DNA adenine methylase [Klebsiella phage phi_KPN_S3]CAD5241801.1 Dam DNA adenine methylase [Klebsiella phage vB_KpM-Milk]CAD5242453.1 Dam DNA adenine methylase [Klebsiella phage vB_KoM-Liquor]
MSYYGVIPYTGNKQKLLPELFKLFPDRNSYMRFIDCFCGGLSVSLNVPKPVLSNDYDRTLIDMYKRLQMLPDLSPVRELIKQHGLGKNEKEAYLTFRDAYNKNKDPLWLYVLILHSFSNVNRTNDKGDFNANFGCRTLNDSTVKRFEHFKNNVRGIEFSSASFKDLDICLNDFVYCDPPYLITDAVYNKFWNEEREHELYDFLDNLNSDGIKFGLSNVTHHAGKQNDILIEWMQKYNVHNLDKKYLLGQHTDSYEQNKTQEVYVCNYQKRDVNTYPETLDDLM